MLRRTLMPAVLVEAGFIDSPEDNRFFDQNFQAIAQAVAEGILTTIRQMEAGGPEYYQVQVGAFRTRMPAERLLKELQNQGFPAFLVYSGGLYKVGWAHSSIWKMESAWSGRCAARDTPRFWCGSRRCTRR